MTGSATFSVNLPDHQVGYNELSRIALEAERMGYNCAWSPDHIWASSPECWATLAALSTQTSKIRLGSMMTCNLWRHPTITAKMVATVDAISKGRVEFGIGAGHYVEEYRMYGVPFPRVEERIQRLREAIEITKRLWTEEKVTYEGSYYSVKDAFCIPKPVQKPHPPVVIGGDGITLSPAVAAKYCDRYNPLPTGLTHEKAKAYLEAFERECEKIGRDPDKVQKIWYGYVLPTNNQEMIGRVRKEIHQPFDAQIVGPSEECVQRIGKYVDSGYTHFVYYTSPHYSIFGTDPLEYMEAFAKEVMSQFS